MSVPRIGDGRQLGDGNLTELTLGVLGEPATATTTATLTAAQVTAGLLVANPGATAATYTLPTVTQVEAVVRGAKIGSTFELPIVNIGTGSGAITLSVTGSTGFTFVGNATIAITSQATLLARKTGVGAWTVYRVA